MYFPEDEIIKEGEIGMNLYFLDKGQVSIYIDSDKQKKAFI